MVYLIWVLVSFLTVQASLAGYTNNWDATSNKTAYTSGNLTVERITWNLIEALATTGDSGDWFNGTRSARGRGYGVSEITMIQNKADGLGYVVFDHRRYGTDAQVNWVAEYSTNSGSSWTLIGSAFTPGASVARFSNDVNVAGNVRIRIRTESSSGTVNRRANFDDIILSDYVVVVEPSVSTTAGTATNTTTATVGGNVTADGGASVTNRGVVFKTSPGVAISDNKTQSGSGNGTFSANLSSLAINTRYYYRAYAQNSVGTALGGELDFWTSANTPGQPTVDNPTSSSLDVTIAVAGNPSGTEFAIQVGGSNYVQADGSVGASAVWQAASAWGTVTVNGLTPSTMYSFAVKARNGADVETAFGSGQSGTTSAGATTPTVSTTIATITNIVTATAGGNVTADGGASVTNRGIIWSVASTPVVPGSQTTNGSGTGAYTSILTNLMAGQTYYYRAFAQNSIGTGYGPEYTLTTLCFDSTVTGLMVSATNNTGFTAEWSALDGAAGYWLDVSTSGTFSIAGDAPAIYTNTFEGVSKGAYASNTLTINGVVWWMHDALIGNLASDRKNGANAARIQNSGAIGMQSSTNMGLSSITFLHGVYGSDGNSDARVEYTSNGWASWSTAGTFTASSTSLTAFEATNINVSGNVAIRIIKTSGGGARLNIDDIRLYGYNTAPDYVAGYSNLFVAGTDQVVTGLNQNTIYYFRLRGAGEDGCVSFNSATQNITTTGTDTTGPTVTNLLVNGGVSLVDSAFSGGVVMTVELRDTGSGLSAGNPAGYVIYYPDGSTESGDFSAGYDEGVTDTVVVTNATALNFANWIPGVYTVMVTAVDVADNQTSNVPFTFSLTDDDVVPPQFYGKSIDGIGGTGDTNLLAGAVAIIGVNGAGVGGDDQGFSFVVLSPFPAGTRFDFVDCGWDTNALGGLGDWYNLNEFHTNTWIATGNADVGQVFRLRLDNINTPGDQVAIYQYDGALSPTNDSANVRFIYAVNLGAGWFDTLVYPGTGTNNQNSTIYRGLTNGQTAVSVPLTSGVANARYIGPTTGTASYLLSQISDSNNWASFSSGFIDLTNFSFSVTGPGDFSWDIPVLTDAQILQGGYMITNIAQDIDSGLLASNTAFGHAPYFVLFGANSNVIVSNQFSTSFSNGSTAVEAMVMSAPAGNYNYIHLGNYNAEIAVADADNDRNNDSLTAKFTMPVVVVDDDEIPPRVGDALVTVMMGGTALVPSVDFTLLAGWNFNQTNTVVSHGVGSFEHNFSSLGNSAGNILNAYLSDVDGRDLTLSGAANVGRYIQFQIDMTGREGLEVSFAARRSDTGYNSNIVSYSVNGGAFEVITQNWTPTNLAANGFGLHVFDLSGATEINNATSVIFRITFGVDGATGGGNNRFDNFQFNAEWMNHYEITDAQLAAVDSGMPLTFSFNAYDTESGIARSISGGPRDMRVTIDGLATNNFTNYVASLSSISTTSTTSTSAWSFLSFTYNQIGNLFASGASNRPVRATFADADDDRPFDELWVSNALFGTFRVIDDDTDPPLLANVNMPNAAARPFVVVTNGIAPMNSEVVRGGQLRRSGTGTNTVFKISDAELAAAGDIGLQFVFGARDVYSGVSRGAAGPGTNDVMSFSIGSLVTGNFADYNAGLSTVQTTTNQLLTNFWAFSNSSFNGSLIESLINAGQQIVRVTIPDSDNDRPNDRALLVSQQVGIIQVIDDDIRGPVISVVELPEIPGGSTILYSSFETGEGWPSFQGSGSVWTNNITSGSATGLWYGTGYINTGEPFDGVRKAGFTVDGVGQYFQLPPRDDVGQLGLVARLSGGETNRYLTAQRWNGSGWDNLGSNLVSSVEYAYMSWDVNVVGASTLRILRTGENGTPGIYIDSVTLTELTDWTSTTQVLVAWAEAVDDYSGVDEYRVVAPAVGAAIPAATNSGQGLGAAITSHTFNITGQQGVITGFVFAIDNDNDRPNDRAMGNLQKIVVRIDTNPPPAVSGIRATDASGDFMFDTSIDETTEIKIEWTAPASEAAAAGWRQSDSAPLSPWDSFIITYFELTDSNGVPIANATTTTLTSATAGWNSTLSNYAFTNLLITNLNFDSYYQISVQGRDQAGNIGPAAIVIGNTDRFVLTQAVARADRDVELFWVGPASDSVLRDYDVIFVDSDTGFRNSLSNQWEFMKYTNRPAAFDLGEEDRPAPRQLTNGIYRFYRVAKSERWLTNQPTRSASAEVYVSKALNLFPGENWHSLFFEPDIPTASFVFGTNRLPSAGTWDQATKITWFTPSSGGNTNQSGQIAESIWLSSSGNWYKKGGFDLANDLTVPLHEAFLIELPMTASSTSLVMVGRVPTQAVVRTISGAGASLNNPIYVMVGQLMPERISLSNLAEQWGGFTPGANISRSDEIRILAPGGDGSLKAPKHRIWRRASDNAWLHHNGASAANLIIEPDDALIFVRRHDTSIVWTNRPMMYQAPTKNLTP